MNPDLKYSDHTRHYQLDGQFYDFFEPDPFMRQEIRRRYQEIVKLAAIRKSDRVLEIGTGGGFILESFTSGIPHYYPVDIPPNNLIKIRQKSNFPLFPTVSDAYYLPFRGNSFDVVIMAEVLEHLAEPAAALAEIKRVLKESGKIIISVPYKEKITYQICIHCNNPTPTHSHLHSFDRNNLKKLIRESGFIPLWLARNCNKISNRLHFNLLFQFLPFPVWKLFDHLFNILSDKPISLIILAQK